MRTVKTLFLEIDTESTWSVASLGPAFLAGMLRRHGHDAVLLRVGLGQGLAEIEAAIAQHAPGLVGVSATTRQWLRSRALLAALRERCDLPVVVGGLHATFAPEEVLRHPGIDLACLGEGETALLALVQALAAQGTAATLRQARLGRLANLWAKGGIKPGLHPPLEPLDALPWPERDMLDEHWGVAHITTQRGCPFPCTYCGARMYDQLYAEQGSHYGRRRSVASVLAELNALRAAGPLTWLIFLDDTFTIHHPWVLDFCAQYGRTLALPFSLHARVETMTPKLLQALAAAGCKHIVYGVESGSDRVRREIMHRSASNQRFREVFAATRAAGIMVTANYILGVPGETVAEMEETLALHHELAPDDFGYFVFYPYPGTALYQQCLAQGWLPADHHELPALHSRSILNLPGVSPDDIARMYQRWTDARAATLLQRTPGADAATAARLQAMAAAHAVSG